MLVETAFLCLAAIPVSQAQSAQQPAPIENTSQPSGETDGDGGGAPPDRPPGDPVLATSSPNPADGVEWRKLARDSVSFLGIMHAFRWATEAGTRSAGAGLGSGYLRSAGNLHGWADGDPFYVNYVGHPMQGAIAGRLFLLNNRRFDRVEFGKSREYWKGKLRAAVFAWAFSEQFEIGPLSEASIGHIQTSFPQQGFVDHVVTPSVGLAWMLGEDAIDRFIVKRVEGRTQNIWIRMAFRTALNPSRSFANVVDGRVPWWRGSRAGVTAYRPETPDPKKSADRSAVTVTDRPAEWKPAPFEITFMPSWRQFRGRGCAGGGADAAWRLLSELQLAVTVNGCKLLKLPHNVSGDVLVYQVGPRWTPVPAGKWSPYAHVLVGGMKITHEQLFPDKKAAVEKANASLDPELAYTLHDQYTGQDESNGLVFSAGTGVDYKLSDALAFRVASLEYVRSSVGTVGGLPYGRGFQVTTGVVLRLGTW